jgi:hypothetical protein
MFFRHHGRIPRHEIVRAPELTGPVAVSGPESGTYLHTRRTTRLLKVVEFSFQPIPRVRRIDENAETVNGLTVPSAMLVFARVAIFHFAFQDFVALTRSDALRECAKVFRPIWLRRLHGRGVISRERENQADCRARAECEVPLFLSSAKMRRPAAVCRALETITVATLPRYGRA